MEPWTTLFWATPILIFSAVVIGWGAETSQMFISQGLALAILAWLQTSPEFAVEAVVAWHQREDLMLANLTGSLRLLVGFGWPLIYFTWIFLGKQKRPQGRFPVIKLRPENSLEVFILLVSTIYFCFVGAKASLTVFDGAVLVIIYVIYLWRLSKMPKADYEEEGDLPIISKKIIKMSKWKRNACIIGLFGLGGLGLRMSVEPFLHGLEKVALAMGISSFFFIQWCAPFVSEFPEKVTAFQWARHNKKVRLALLNMISSNIVQWTLMAALLPMIYSVSKGVATPIFFDKQHQEEIFITIAQSFLTIVFLMDLELSFSNAAGLFVLWLVQFIVPSWRMPVTFAYGLWAAFELIRLTHKGKMFYALTELRKLNKNAS